MDSKSLMIGDWYLNQEYEENRQWTIDDYFETNTEYSEPIPLTAEMLEKNGLGSNEGTNICFSHTSLIDDNTSIHFQHISDKKVWYMRLFRCNAGGFEIIIQPTYVHELQHTLRLCGLAELADNFEV